MAFPTIAAIGNSTEGTATTSHDVVMPSGISAGDLLLHIITHDGAITFSGWPAGWTVFPRNLGGTTVGQQIAYKYAVGGETDFVLTSSGSEESQSRVYRITGHAGPTRPPLIRGVSSSADPPLVAIREWVLPHDVLAFAVLGWENSTATNYPASYTGNQYNNAFVAAHGIRLATQDVTITSAFPGEDPATYSGGAGSRCAHTILIPSDSGDPDITFPVMRDHVGRNSNAGATSALMVLPLQFVVGDILVAALSTATGATVSSGLPAGWTEVVNVRNTSGARLYIWWKLADGSETDFTLNLSGSTGSVARVFAVLGADTVTALSATTATGSSANPDSPSHTAGAVSNLWLAVMTSESNAATVMPTNYNHFHEPAGGSGSVNLAARQLAATTEDPGSFTISTSRFWASATVALAATGGVGGSSRAQVIWMD